MGDRGVIQVNQSHFDQGIGVISLYTHWGGGELPQVLARALARSSDRWNDEAYLTRIIFNEMTKGREMDSIGFGIMACRAKEIDTNNPPIILSWSEASKAYALNLKANDLVITCNIWEENSIYSPEEFIDEFMPEPEPDYDIHKEIDGFLKPPRRVVEDDE